MQKEAHHFRANRNTLKYADYFLFDFQHRKARKNTPLEWRERGGMFRFFNIISFFRS